MKKKIINTIWVMGVLALAGFCLSACNHELDIQQAYPFTVETMPVQKHIVKGQTAEIRCTLKRQGWFEDARYTIRYFQPDGKGRLKMDDGTVFKPNDRYPLTKEVFRLYYTSASSDQQTIDVYVEDNFGQMVKLSFEFNSQKDEEKEKTNGDKKYTSRFIVLPCLPILLPPFRSGGWKGSLFTTAVRACRCLHQVLRGLTFLEGLSLCRLRTSASARRAVHGSDDGTAGGLSASG